MSLLCGADIWLGLTWLGSGGVGSGGVGSGWVGFTSSRTGWIWIMGNG